MTTYTTIPNTDVDQDSPITVTLMTALRDNPTAITEGASGAPEILPAALLAPTAGATYTLLEIVNSTSRTMYKTSYSTVVDHAIDGSYTGGDDNYFTQRVRVLVPGVIRVTLDHGENNNGTSYVRTLLNGVEQDTGSNPSGTYSTFTSDITVAVGDIVTIQQRSSNTNTASVKIRNVKILSGTECPWAVVYYP